MLTFGTPRRTNGDLCTTFGAIHGIFRGNDRFNFSPTVLADFRFPENGFSTEGALPHAAYVWGGGSHKADDQESDRPK